MEVRTIAEAGQKPQIEEHKAFARRVLRRKVDLRIGDVQRQSSTRYLVSVTLVDSRGAIRVGGRFAITGALEGDDPAQPVTTVKADTAAAKRLEDLPRLPFKRGASVALTGRAEVLSKRGLGFSRYPDGDLAEQVAPEGKLDIPLLRGVALPGGSGIDAVRDLPLSKSTRFLLRTKRGTVSTSRKGLGQALRPGCEMRARWSATRPRESADDILRRRPNEVTLSVGTCPPRTDSDRYLQSGAP